MHNVMVVLHCSQVDGVLNLERNPLLIVRPVPK